MKSRWQNFLAQAWEFAGGVSVRTKIFGIVLGSTLMLSLGFFFQVRTAQTRMLVSKTQEQGLSIARDVAARATDLILINDLYSLHQLLSETQNNFQDVRYVFILDPQNQVLVHTFNSGFPRELIALNQVAADAYHNTRVLQTDEGLVWDVAVPIFGGEAGTARVGISDRSVQATLAQLTSQMLLTIVGVLMLSLLAATFLTWILTRPILGLVEATQAVARGDFSPRVRRWANDEIGDLAESFNQMTEELARLEEIRQEREQLRRQLLEGVITAQEEERRRIARELHDSTSQSLTSLIVGLRTLDTMCDNPKMHTQLENMRRVVIQTLEDVHNLALQLRPAVLDDLGLRAAIERLARDWQAHHQLKVDVMVHLGKARLPDAVETTIYRIVQEALTNVARHADAHSVSILVERHAGEVIAVIEDDGRGFHTQKKPGDGHLGLLGMEERARLLGGRLVIESEPGHGTSIFARIPLHRFLPSHETAEDKGAQT